MSNDSHEQTLLLRGVPRNKTTLNDADLCDGNNKGSKCKVILASKHDVLNDGYKSGR